MWSSISHAGFPFMDEKAIFITEICPHLTILPHAAELLNTTFETAMPGKTLAVLGSGPGIGVAVARAFSVSHIQ